MARLDNLQFLTENEVDLIFNKVLKIIEEKGVRVDHEEGLKTLEKAGAKVDHKTHVVRFTRDIVEDALKSVPREFTITGNYPLPNPEGIIYGNCETGSNYFFNPETGDREDTTCDSVKLYAQINEKLDPIKICAYVSPVDAPPKTADIHAVRNIFFAISSLQIRQVSSMTEASFLLIRRSAERVISLTTSWSSIVTLPRL